MYDPYAEFQKEVLPNGLEIYHAFWDRPWIKVEFIVHSGGREDPISLPGLAHFLEHCVSENVPDHNSSTLDRFFQSVGGEVSLGSTSYLSAKYSFFIPADLHILREALKLFGGMLLNAEIEKGVERERLVICREFSEKNPVLKVLEWNQEVRRLLFKGHRLETWYGPIGIPEGFLSARKEDLQDYYNTHYVPGNISMVVVGGLSGDQIRDEVEKSPLGIQKNGRRNPIPEPYNQYPKLSERTKHIRYSDFSNFQVDSTRLVSKAVFPGKFPRWALKVFASALSEYLFEDIRKKRTSTYGVRVSWHDFQDVIQFEMKSHVDPKTTQEIDSLVQECIDTVLSQMSLDRTINYTYRRLQMVDVSGSGLVGRLGNDLEHQQRIVTLRENLKELQTVTSEQMYEAASYLSPDRRHTTIFYP